MGSPNTAVTNDPPPLLPWRDEGPLGRETDPRLQVLSSLVCIALGVYRPKVKLENMDIIKHVIPHLAIYQLGATQVVFATQAMDFRDSARKTLSELPSASNPGGVSDRAAFDLQFVTAMDAVDSPTSQAFLNAFLQPVWASSLTSTVRIMHALYIRLGTPK